MSVCMVKVCGILKKALQNFLSGMLKKPLDPLFKTFSVYNSPYILHFRSATEH